MKIKGYSLCDWIQVEKGLFKKYEDGISSINLGTNAQEFSDGHRSTAFDTSSKYSSRYHNCVFMLGKGVENDENNSLLTHSIDNLKKDELTRNHYKAMIEKIINNSESGTVEFVLGGGDLVRSGNSASEQSKIVLGDIISTVSRGVCEPIVIKADEVERGFQAFEKIVFYNGKKNVLHIADGTADHFPNEAINPLKRIFTFAEFVSNK